MRAAGRTWPAVAGGLLAVLVLAGSFVYPVVVEPLFNHFTSLPDGELRTRVLALADQEGVRVDDVLVADASRRTTTLTRHVSGFGDTRRVVLYDNLVNDVPQEQTLSVVAHDIRPCQARRRADRLAHRGGGRPVRRRSARARRRCGRGPARRHHARPRGRTLVLALIAVATLLTMPVENGISRRIETRADVDALVATRDPEAFVAVQRETRPALALGPTPPAWAQWWFGSHPITLVRIAIAEQIGGSRGPSPAGPPRGRPWAPECIDGADLRSAAIDVGGSASEHQGAPPMPVLVSLNAPARCCRAGNTRGHHDRRDTGHEQAVLDRGRAALVHLGLVCLDEDHQVLKHWGLLPLFVSHS